MREVFFCGADGVAGYVVVEGGEGVVEGIIDLGDDLVVDDDYLGAAAVSYGDLVGY